MIEHGNAPDGVDLVNTILERKEARTSLENERTARARLGIVSMLDQFLDTFHPLAKRQVMAADLGVRTVDLESLIACASTGHPKTVLKARLNLTLLMAGSGRRVR